MASQRDGGGLPPRPPEGSSGASGGAPLPLGTDNAEEDGSFGLAPKGLRILVSGSARSMQPSDDDDLEPPSNIQRSVSRQSNAPVWLANEMTTLAGNRIVTPRPLVTPRPPPSVTPRPYSVSTIDDGNESLDENERERYDTFTEEEVRMLRHLEQHTHMQEEVQVDELSNAQRAEQIQRENNRLIHISMRRENRNAQARGNSHHDHNNDTGKDGMESEDGSQRFSRQASTDGSPRFGLIHSYSLNDSYMSEPNTAALDKHTEAFTSENEIPHERDDQDDRVRNKPIPYESMAGAAAESKDSKSSVGCAKRGESDPLGKQSFAVQANESTRRHNFGFLKSPLNISRRRTHVPKRDQGRLPPSFTSQRQRQRLSAIFKNRDLGDATLWEALMKIRPLHPSGKFRSYWDRLLVLLVMYTMITVPIEVAFDGGEVAFRLIGIVLDLVFIVDIWFAFRTSYLEADDQYVRDFRQIERHYLRTWFALDLLAAIPVNIILAIISGYLPVHVDDYVTLIKLIKVFRLFRIRHLFYALAGLRTSVYIYLLIVVSGFILAAHWFACIFWKIAELEQESGMPSWVTLQPVYQNLFDEPMPVKYAISMYWSVTTITTLGYGDIRPRTYAEQIYTCIVIIVGVSLYAAVIGLIAYIMRSQLESELQKENHSESIRTFGRQYHLPLALQHRIQAYFDFLWERKKRLTSKSLVDDLPLELRADIADAIHRKLINGNPLLRECTTLGFKKVFAARLSASVVRIPDDMLYFEGDEVTEIFFIKKGLADIVFGLDRGGNLEFPVARRGDGQYLGDMGLFIRTKTVDQVGDDSADHTADWTEDDESEDASEASEAEDNSESGSVSGRGRKSKTKMRERTLHHTSAMVVAFSEISSLMVSDFLQLLEQFPREKALFKAVAKARFNASKEIVEARLGKYDDSSTPNVSSVPRRMRRFGSSSRALPVETVGSNRSPPSPPSVSRAVNMPTDLGANSIGSEPQLPALSDSIFLRDPRQSARNRMVQTVSEHVPPTISLQNANQESSSSRLLSGTISGLIPATLRGQASAREVPLLITPEMDDKLVRETVERVLSGGTVEKLRKKAKKKEKQRKMLKGASRFLLSPAHTFTKTRSSLTATKQGAPAMDLQAEPLSQTNSAELNPPDPSRLNQVTAESLSGPPKADAPTQAFLKHSRSPALTAAQSLGDFRTMSVRSRELHRRHASEVPALETPPLATSQNLALELKLKTLMSRMRRLEAEIDSASPSNNALSEPTVSRRRRQQFL